jgi:hypothetical protein
MTCEDCAKPVAVASVTASAAMRTVERTVMLITASLEEGAYEARRLNRSRNRS